MCQLRLQQSWGQHGLVAGIRNVGKDHFIGYNQQLGSESGIAAQLITMKQKHCLEVFTIKQEDPWILLQIGANMNMSQFLLLEGSGNTLRIRSYNRKGVLTKEIYYLNCINLAVHGAICSPDNQYWTFCHQQDADHAVLRLLNHDLVEVMAHSYEAHLRPNSPLCFDVGVTIEPRWCSLKGKNYLFLASNNKLLVLRQQGTELVIDAQLLLSQVPLGLDVVQVNEGLVRVSLGLSALSKVEYLRLNSSNCANSESLENLLIYTYDGRKLNKLFGYSLFGSINTCCFLSANYIILVQGLGSSRSCCLTLMEIDQGTISQVIPVDSISPIIIGSPETKAKYLLLGTDGLMTFNLLLFRILRG